jgi:hypothetical protein
VTASESLKETVSVSESESESACRGPEMPSASGTPWVSETMSASGSLWASANPMGQGLELPKD